jgi:hypothetical protein
MTLARIQTKNAMRTNVPERLLAIVEQIDEQGSAETTRLTVLKKWFENRPERLPAFAVFVAARATSRKGKTSGDAATLFREAKALLAGHNKFQPVLDRDRAQILHARLTAFQNEYRNIGWGAVRVIHNWNLMLIEHGLAIYLGREPSPTAGYRLAAQYCQNYDSRYVADLNGPNSTKILEIVRWMFTLEAVEDLDKPGGQEASTPSSTRTSCQHSSGRRRS